MRFKLLLPLASALMLAFAVFHVVRAHQQPPPAIPPVAPATSPFRQTVAGSGLVEPQSEKIAVGSHLPGVVAEVFVKVGQAVRAGDPLFRLDDRHLKAERAIRETRLIAAEAALARLEAMPRPEEVPISEAKVREARAALEDQRDLLQRSERLFTSRSIGEEELVRKRQALAVAREQLARAQADLDLLRAGAWEPEKAVARAEVVRARAELAQTHVELERLQVCAPAAGRVLQVNVRPGEFVGAPPGQALIVMGQTDCLHVRIDIDETDISRYRLGVPGVARLRGDPSKEFALTFVRVEPFVIPKKSLTGSNTERVDTRVLQLIYAIAPGDEPLYVGMQLDVFFPCGADAQTSTGDVAKN